MPSQLGSCTTLVAIVLLLLAIDCRPQSWVERRLLTDAQLAERDKLILPIIQGVVARKRQQWDVMHAPSLEGKLELDIQPLLDLADWVYHDPSKNRKRHIFTMDPSEADEDGRPIYHMVIFIIVVQDEHIESAELPPQMD